MTKKPGNSDFHDIAPPVDEAGFLDDTQCDEGVSSGNQEGVAMYGSLQLPEADGVDTRPEGDIQCGLQLGNGVAIGETFTADESLNSGVIHVDFTRKTTYRPITTQRGVDSDLTDGHGELAQPFVDGVFDDTVGPIGVKLPRLGAGDAATAITGLVHSNNPNNPDVFPIQPREKTAQPELGATPAILQEQALPADVAKVIYQWTPRKLSVTDWNRIRPLATELLVWLHTEHGWSAQTLSTTRSSIVKFFTFCYVSMALEPDKDLLTPELINNYLIDQGRELSHKETEYKRLVFLSKHLHPDLWEFPQPLQREHNPPYTDAEVRAFQDWAASQSTPARKHYCHTLLALAGGVGLRSWEIRELQAIDVTITHGSVLINMGRLRGTDSVLVPVQPRFAEVVAKAAAQAPAPTTQIARPNNIPLSRYLYVTNLRHQKSPRLMRLRNTWIVKQLQAGMSEEDVARLAGLSRVADYRDWAAHHMF